MHSSLQRCRLRSALQCGLLVNFFATCGSPSKPAVTPVVAASNQSVTPNPPTSSPVVVPQSADPVTNEMLIAHNRVRANHCAAPLVWSDKLAGVAQAWANTLRDRNCAFSHSGSMYGENLAAGTTGTLRPTDVVTMWYGENSQYAFNAPGFSMSTGHFTQVVWRNTTQVGCGTSQCNNMEITVCNYDPAGNVETQFQDNVLPQGCR
jgi:pathogenesis-related protein 1